MSKVVTIRLDEKVYHLIKKLASQDNRPLGNFIETATLRWIEENGLVDDLEQAELDANTALKASHQRGLKDYRQGKGSFV